MQCLEKEPSRRYQAVNELIADLDRYLRHEPVLARPPSFVYTVRKFARRNRIAFASALVAVTFVVFITTFAVTMTVQAQRIAAERDRAERERQRAQKVSNVALNVFAIADPFQSLGNDVSGSALLEQAANSIERELQRPASRPRARLLQAVVVHTSEEANSNQRFDYLRDAVARTQPNGRGAESETLMAMVDLSYGPTHQR